MMSKKSKPTFFAQFKDSFFLRPVIKKLWVKPRKLKVCELCNKVTADTLQIMVRKQLTIIQSLAESVAKVERVMADRQHLIDQFLIQLNEVKDERNELKERLEVIKNAH